MISTTKKCALSRETKAFRWVCLVFRAMGQKKGIEENQAAIEKRLGMHVFSVLLKTYFEKMSNSDPNKKILFWAQVGFWLGYFLLHGIIALSYTTWARAGLIALVNACFFACIAYANVLWLMPQFFLRRRYVLYAVMCFVFLAVIALGRQYISQLTAPPNDVDPRPFLYIFLYYFGSSFINLLVTIPIKYAFDFAKLQARQQQMANAQLEAEMKLLKMQLHPHFMFNTLNNLYYLTRIKSDIAPQVVEKLSDLMRYLLEKNDAEKVYLKDEINFMQAYMDLEKIRVPHLQLTFDITGNTENVMVPPLLGLPLLENAFKHGIDKNSAGNCIKVTLQIENGQLELTTLNPMHAFKKPGNRLGLANLKKRLQLLYGDRFILKTEEQTEQKHYFTQLIVPII